MHVPRFAAVVHCFQNGQFIGGYHFVQKINVTAIFEKQKKRKEERIIELITMLTFTRSKSKMIVADVHTNAVLIYCSAGEKQKLESPHAMFANRIQSIYLFGNVACAHE